MKVIKYILVLCFIFSIATTQAQSPKEILGIAKEHYDANYYKVQSKLWKKEIAGNPTDGYSWFQYYKAQRAYLQLTKPEVWANNQNEIFDELEPIIEECKANTGESFDYYLLKGVNRSTDRLPFLEKAFDINQDRKEIYEDLLVGYTKNGNHERARRIAKKILMKNIYSNNSLIWSDNILRTITGKGVYLGNGDMDVLTKWAIQSGRNDHQDVLVISKWSMVFDEDYRDYIFKELGLTYNVKPELKNDPQAMLNDITSFIITNCTLPIYMSCGTNTKTLKELGIDKNTYLLGLTFAYSSSPIDNISKTVDLFNNTYHLEHLGNNFQVHHEDSIVYKFMNPTYLPGLFETKNYFQTKGNQKKALFYNNLIENITDKSGRKKEIKSWLNNN